MLKEETFIFRLFPDYTYTISQNKRFVFTQGYYKHFQKAINFADKIGKPNQISLIYMLGYDGKMINAVKKTKGNVVILCAKIPEQEFEVYDDYTELVKLYSKSGCADSETGELTERFFETQHKLVEAYDKYGVEKEAADNAKRELLIVERYDELKQRIGKYFERYTIIDKLHPVKTIAHSNLNAIAKRYFPFGLEQTGLISTKACMPQNLNKALQAGILDTDCKFLLEDAKGNMREACWHGVKRLRMDIATEIREVGYANLSNVIDNLKNAPYGFMADAYTAYCLGNAAKYFENCFVYYHGVSYRASNISIGFWHGFAFGFYATKKDELVIYSEDGWRLSNRLKLIFAHLGFQNANTSPVGNLLLDLREKISEYTRFPVSILDAKLNSILNDKGYYSSRRLKELLDYYNWDLCEKLHKKIFTINEDIPIFLKKKYGENTANRIINQLPQAAGWLWSKETFDRLCERCSESGDQNHEKKN